jgi:hypothetical protein
MKKILSLFLFAVCISFKVQAQMTSLASFDVTIHNPSTNQFFDRHKNIDHVIIFYNKVDAETVEIFFRGKPEPFLGERYVLSFDGDVHLFNKKYKDSLLPNAVTAKLTYLQGIKKIRDTNTMYNLTTTLRRDSLKHHFSFFTVSGNTEPYFGPQGYYPTFKGDISKLTKRLEQDFKKWKSIAVTGSIIILIGLVEKNGTIGTLKLIEGTRSPYSDKVLEFMSREATSWLPKFDGGGKRAWPVRISVRINKDETLKVSIL